MNIISKYLTLAIMLVANAWTTAQKPNFYGEKNPDWWIESMKTRDQRVEWYREAKFGMFVHWGVYSQLAGYWQGKPVTGYSEHILRSMRIPLVDYADQVAAKFNPIQFNADEWIRLCKAAGMRYFVITAKHHDGLAMWPSDVNEWDIADATPFDRDPLAELRDACKKYEVHFGIYYSQAQDWSHPGGQRNIWDFPHQPTNRASSWFHEPNKAEHIKRSEEYITDKSIPQLLEVVKRYKPDLIWFDTSSWLPPYMNQIVLKALREVAPSIVVSSRIGSNMGDYESTCDQPIDFQPYHHKYDVWEGIPTTNMSYGYHAGDKSHKPASFFIELLAKSVERGGNLLMNIGPMGNGLIDQVDIVILKGIGRWLEDNGEAIYGTTHSPLSIQTFGHISRKDNLLYLHVTRWPEDGKIVVADLETPIKKAWLLAAPLAGDLKVTKIGDKDWGIQGPSLPLDPINTVLVIETENEPKGNTDAPIRLASNIATQRLHVFDNHEMTDGLSFGHGNGRDNGIKGWNKKVLEKGCIAWTVRVDEPVTFALVLIYVGLEGKHGGQYEIKIGDQVLTGTVETQPIPENTKKVKYLPYNLGTISLKPGIHRIELRGIEITSQELFLPSSILLHKK